MENQQFFNFLAGQYATNKELNKEFCGMVKTEKFNKHHVILSSGQISSKMWFIVEGFAMAYVSADGKKIPYWFWDEKEIMVSIDSFFNQVPAEGYIEILEKSTILSISYDNIQKLIRDYSDFNMMIRCLIQSYHRASEKRILSFAAITAEERYATLLKESSVIVRKAPVEIIASYIGVSRKTLNRIRAKR